GAIVCWAVMVRLLLRWTYCVWSSSVRPASPPWSTAPTGTPALPTITLNSFASAALDFLPKWVPLMLVSPVVPSALWGCRHVHCHHQPPPAASVLQIGRRRTRWRYSWPAPCRRPSSPHPQSG